MRDSEFIAMRLNEGDQQGARRGRWQRLVRALAGGRPPVAGAPSRPLSYEERGASPNE